MAKLISFITAAKSFDLNFNESKDKVLLRMLTKNAETLGKSVKRKWNTELENCQVADGFACHPNEEVIEEGQWIFIKCSPLKDKKV